MTGYVWVACHCLLLVIQILRVRFLKLVISESPTHGKFAVHAIKHNEVFSILDSLLFRSLRRFVIIAERLSGVTGLKHCSRITRVGTINMIRCHQHNTCRGPCCLSILLSDKSSIKIHESVLKGLRIVFFQIKLTFD